MAEGVEIHLIVEEGIKKHMLGAVIRKVVTTEEYKDIPPREGWILEDILAWGKSIYMIWKTDINTTVYTRTHLRIKGRLYLSSYVETTSVNEKYRLVMITRDNKAKDIVYCDDNSVGEFEVVNELPKMTKEYRCIFDEDDEDFENTKSSLQKYKSNSLCTWLLDQRRFTGIGTYLTSELLYVAKLGYNKQCGSLTDDEIKRLLDSLETIKEDVRVSGGYSKNMPLHFDGDIGYYIPQIYGKKCTNYGEKVKAANSHGRTIYVIDGKIS